jgi:hypothetical protein
MHIAPRKNWPATALLVALMYTMVGVVTANLAGSAESNQLRSFWRLSALALSLIVFVSHLRYERVKLGSVTKTAAFHTAVAVAVGAFALAVIGPARSHWGAGDFSRSVGLSLVLWPVLAGVPAFVVAIVAGSLFARAAERERSTQT